MSDKKVRVMTQWRVFQRNVIGRMLQIGKMLAAALALSVGGAAFGGGAAADEATTAPPAGQEPTLCQMARAFDEALRLRYYRANLAPDDLECNFLAEKGCPYTLRRQIVIKVTHLEPLGCDESGECAFKARQICEIGEFGADCAAIMAMPASNYVVAGTFSSDGERWKLTDWRREPTGPLASQSVVSTQCPQIL